MATCSRAHDGLGQLAGEHLWKVRLHQDDRREVVAGAHLELRVIAAGKAVVAGVRAAAIGVQRPLERHALRAVERRATHHFLVGRVIGAPVGVGQRGDAAGLQRRPRCRASWACARRAGTGQAGPCFDFCSPMLARNAAAVNRDVRSYGRDLGSVDVRCATSSSRSSRVRSRGMSGCPARGAAQFVGGPDDDRHVDGTETRRVDDDLNRHTTSRDQAVDQVMDGHGTARADVEAVATRGRVRPCRRTRGRHRARR